VTACELAIPVPKHWIFLYWGIRRQKKTRKENLAGLVTMSELYYLAGTVAIRTHVPLARHGFCVFYRNEIIDALAQFVGVVKIHRRSRADITAKVKYGI
jgi:hypothetical protein